MGSTEITAAAERKTENGDRIFQFMAECRVLRPGDLDIRAESIMQNPDEKEFTATGYIGGMRRQEGKALRMTNPKSISKWRLGRMHVERGRDKDSIDVQVKYLDRSELLE